MANVIDRQIIEEGYRNFVVKLTGALDGVDANVSPAISLTDCKDNAPRPSGALVGFRIDHITYAISMGIEVLLSWNGSAPQQIAPLSGRGKFDLSTDGGALPDQTRTGYDGSINLTTTGMSSATVAQYYTIVLHMVKLYASS